VRKFLAAVFTLNTLNAKRLTLNAFLVFFFLFIVSSLLFNVKPVHAQGIFTTDKLITVDIGRQMVYAWQGGKIVFSTKASTGMYYTPTVKGNFKIQTKIPLQNMKGNYPPYEPYFIKNVPNVMYFYQAYAIHGAYWHNMFGSKYTHGCVNVPVAASAWLYNFADVGTQVAVF
jgi:lipoprotein-anchoring transpeptidase ErfK/SrfK